MTYDFKVIYNQTPATMSAAVHTVILMPVIMLCYILVVLARAGCMQQAEAQPSRKQVLQTPSQGSSTDLASAPASEEQPLPNDAAAPDAAAQ